MSFDKNRFKYILFDVDGVLVDSEKVFNHCWMSAATALGYDLSFNQALDLRSCNSEVAQFLFEKWFNDSFAYAKVRQRRKELMADYIKQNPITAKPGVRDIFSTAKELNLLVAIVTSSPYDRCKSYLESVGIDLDFEIISGDMVKKGKPEPDIYKYACSQLGVLPCECIAVEDAPNGLLSAHKAGCYTIMIPDLSPYSDDLCDVVNICCPNLNELSKWLMNK